MTNVSEKGIQFFLTGTEEINLPKQYLATSINMPVSGCISVKYLASRTPH
jgi:hypothetical protein